MPRAKFVVGETVEVRCSFSQAGALVTDWLAGKVVQADNRMVAVQFELDVFTTIGGPAPDRILWCAHGSPNIRRLNQGESAE